MKIEIINHTKRFIKFGINSIQHPDLLKKNINYFVSKLRDDRLAKQGYFPYHNNIIFLAGMGLGGSTWFKNMLAHIPGYYTRSTPMPWEVAYNQNICDSAFRYTSKNNFTLFKTHLNPTRENLDCITRNGVTKILITYRDLRDVALSRTHRQMIKPKPKYAPDFVDYNEMGFNMALEHSINHIAENYIPWINGWLEFKKTNPEMYHVARFEDLKVDLKGTYQKILDFYGITLSDELIDSIIEKTKGKGAVSQNLSNAIALPWGLSTNFRSGKIGGWRNEFTQVHIDLAELKLREALTDLGYE